jgi:hypothetical protein
LRRLVACSSPPPLWGTPGKSQIPPGIGRGWRLASLTSWGLVLELAPIGGTCGSRRFASSFPYASGTMAGSNIGCFVAPWLGWQFCVASATRLSARSTFLRGSGLALGQGGGPGYWCGRRGLRAVFPMQHGLRVAGSCGIVARVRAVVRRDGGPGRWCWRSVGRGGAVGCQGSGFKALTVWRAS